MSSTSTSAPQDSAIAETAVANPPQKKKGGPPRDLPPPEPTLAAYYGKPTPRLADWIKAIKTAKLQAFAEADLENARAELPDSDFDLRKTLALANVQNPPAPVRRWVNEVTQRALKEQLPHFLFDPAGPAGEQIGRIAEGLGAGLGGPNKRDRARNEALLQLALQLVLKLHSDFDAGAILAVLFQPLRATGNKDTRLAPGELRKRLLEAGVRQLRDLSLVQASAQDRIAQAERARREAHERAEDAVVKLQMERELVKSLRTELAESQSQAQALSAEVTKLKTAVEDTKQIGAHGTTKLFAKVRTLLANRLPPLLEDAADALSKEPFYVDIAQERITSVRTIIKGEVAWLDESSD